MGSNTFSWLHLSDLHVGLSAQGWLWPTVKNALYEDLERLHHKQGPWDIVIFSGDFTQRSSVEEYQRLQGVLDELWSVFDRLGFNPPLFPVPGNHDLVRPPKEAPAALLLRRWWEESSVREGVLSANSPYYDCLCDAFANYQNWLKSTELTSGVDLTFGLLPGDVSGVLQARDTRVGLLGLNSAWLQLSDGNFERQLHVDPRQILSLTGDDPERWVKDNHINFLVTHHPESWLHKEAEFEWLSEINPPGRFDAHLFGHMHHADDVVSSRAGSDARSSIQAASLFGLETIGNGEVERIHGYSLGSISFDGDHRVRRVWPRRLHRHNSGKRRLIPDYSFELDDDEAFTVQYPRGKGAEPNKSVARSVPSETVQVAPGSPSGDALLEKLRFQFRAAPGHQNVRVPEQNALTAALREKRIAWLSAEWGLGSNGFIWSARQRLGHEAAPTFRFDLESFSTRDKFLDDIKEGFGSSFEQLCELISRKSTSYILLDSVPIDQHLTIPTSNLVADLDDMARVISEYCPQAFIIIRTRFEVPSTAYPAIKLTALDEPDTSRYIKDANVNAQQLGSAQALQKLHTHTDGFPARIDTALQELQVVRLADLVSANPDFATGVNLAAAPPALIKAVFNLQRTADPFLKRAYELLKTLSAFPQGEQLNRVKRFNHSAPFFAPHATHLRERGLIDASQPIELRPGADATDSAPVLSVPKVIRDHIRGTLKQAEAASLDRKAMELYFGPKWKTGELTFTPGHRFDDPLQSGYKIANAGALVTRFLRNAIDEGSAESIISAIRVVSSYLNSLVKGDHFRSVASMCADIFDTVPPDEFEAQLSYIRYLYGRCLRMIGETERARDVLRNLDLSLLQKDWRQAALLNLALSYQTLHQDDDAKDTAERVISLGKSDLSAIHARAILAELDKSDPNRLSKLQQLETTARRRKANILANTIALCRANASDVDVEESERIYEEVAFRARATKDFYNGVRAIVRVCRTRLDRGDDITHSQRSGLIEAYHFLFNERLSGLFDGCHSVLWDEFENSKDDENLLRLFRHSSLIWRLRGFLAREKEYVLRLAERVGSGATGSFQGLERERAYFTGRASATLIEDQRPKV